MADTVFDMRAQRAVSAPPKAGILTIAETAAYLRVSVATIYRLLKQHKIPAFKVARD
jgi:excisionase family DNA binding protein